MIQKLEDEWRARWEKYKMDIVMKNRFALASGKILNPGKSFYLGLPAAAVRDVSAMRDADGIRYARKAMIRTGMALNINGLWEERQFSEAPRDFEQIPQPFQWCSCYR